MANNIIDSSHSRMESSQNEGAEGAAEYCSTYN